MTETLLEGQHAQLAGAPLGDNPYRWKMVPSREQLKSFWDKGYMMAEQQALGPVDPETGAPVLRVMVQKEGSRRRP
jgi:hypothetical protein